VSADEYCPSKDFNNLFMVVFGFVNKKKTHTKKGGSILTRLREKDEECDVGIK
jgi:hypothetical protein